MGGWHPKIGDPSFMGWFTVGSYFGCAILSFIVALASQKGDRRSFFFWGMISIFMIVLGINKQLELQSLLTEVGRQIAKAQGWMDQRRIVQFWFIVAFGTTTMTAFLLIAIIMRNLFRQHILVFTGLFVLLTFVITRAASFQHFDEMLGMRFFGAKMNWLLELTGIFSIVIAGLKEIIHLRKINTK
jgi:hypothetical protein